LACILARKVIWKATATALPNKLITTKRWMQHHLLNILNLFFMLYIYIKGRPHRTYFWISNVYLKQLLSLGFSLKKFVSHKLVKNFCLSFWIYTLIFLINIFLPFFILSYLFFSFFLSALFFLISRWVFIRFC